MTYRDDVDRPGDVTRRFDLLADALAAEGLEEEVCKVGGAVLRVVFRAAPGTRRPRALFGDLARAKAAEERVGERAGLPGDWLEPDVRGYLYEDHVIYDRGTLRIYVPPPDYLLAMKCAALRFAPDSSTESEIRYLLTFLGLRTPERAMDLIGSYLTPRQRPADLRERIEALLP